MSNHPVPHKIGRIKWYWYVGGAAAVAVVFYGYRRSTAAANAAAATTDASGVDPNALDTGTGAGYSPIGVSPSLYGFTDPSTGAFIGGIGGGGTQVVTAPTTNGQWAQLVEAYLIQNSFDPITSSIAIGKYLAGRDLTANEIQIVQAGIAFYGKPPQPVADPHGAPPAGQTVGLATPHLSKSNITKAHAVLRWTAVPGATSYHLHKNTTWIPITGTSHTVNRPGVFFVVAVAGTKSSSASNVVAV